LSVAQKKARVQNWRNSVLSESKRKS